MTDASEFTGFHQALAQKIIPHLKPGDTLCDMGCGLGRLDFELARFVSEIHAFDVCEYAIASIEKSLRRAGIRNIFPRQSDVPEPDGDYDVILVSRYGRADMEMLLRHCRRKLIQIAGSNQKSGLYPAKYRREVKNAVPLIAQDLEMMGISYTLEQCSFEFGQPLRTWQDARQFVLNNAPAAQTDEIDDFLNENIEQTGRDDFPYYLPYRKELGIFVISAE